MFTWINKSFLIKAILISGPGSKKHYPHNNSYKIHCVKCPWFWFWLVFVPYPTWAVFCSMGETLDVQLPPIFAISNSALKGNSLKKIQTFIQLKMDVCVPYAIRLLVSLWRRDLPWDSLPIITYVPPNWSKKWKIFGLRQVCRMSNY